ncbi:glycosyltransferase [Pseudoduganella sp. GCM10020061]|uniref:glycosyltransferase n=1 Tax=Pseudoduganella sp. GCM10020061 TaxID=3317345 RepID=UPI00363D3599
MHLADITMFYAAEGGGVSTYLNAKSDWLRQRGVTHTILSPNVDSGGHLVALPSLPVPGLHGYKWPWTVSHCARILRELAPDLVEAGDAGPCAYAALRAARALGIPAVAFYHSDTPRLLLRRLGTVAEMGCERYLATLYRRFDLVLAPSRLMVQRLAAMGVEGALHQTLGIDSRTFSPQRRDPGLRTELGLPADARLLVYAGRFTPEKRLDVLAGALARLGEPYYLLLIGDGPSPPEPGERIVQRDFLRDRGELARMLASCDVLVHAGDSETFGLIALEAMSCGLPVVCTGGGIAELVTPGTGVHAEPDNVEAFAAAVESVYRMDRMALAANARRKAVEQHDWDVVLPQVMARYERLLAPKRGRTPDIAGARADSLFWRK